MATVGSTCAGSTRTRSPTRTEPGTSGANVMCSSEQNHTAAPGMLGLPWSMPSDLSPTSATAQPSDTEITVPSTDSAWANGRPSEPYAVSIRAYEPAWISVAQVFTA